MPRVIQCLAATAVVMFCVQVFSDNKADVDLWGNVGFVRSPPWSGSYHDANTFSFTEPDTSWVNHEWLAEYALNRVYTFLGNPGLLLLKIALGLLVVALVHSSMSRSGLSGPGRFLVLLLIVSTMGYGFSTRPHHFTYLLTAVFLWVLRHSRRRALVLFGLPALGALWANLHGAFLAGALLLVVRTAGEACRALSRQRPDARTNDLPLLAAATALFLGATLLNPYGVRLWRFVFASAALVRPYLSEWAAFHPLHDFWTHVDFVVLVALGGAALAFSRTPKDPVWMAVLAVSLVAALVLRRNIPLFAVVVGFVLPPHLAACANRPLERLQRRVSRPLLAAILAAFVAVSARYAYAFHKEQPFQIEVPRERFPVDLVAGMQAHALSGHALVFFDWAEYCIWKLYPRCRVFLDGRFLSAYHERTIRDYFRFLYADEDWDAALTDYPTDIVLIHTGNPVYARMVGREGWVQVARTDLAALFLKESAHGPFLARLRAGNTGLVQPATETVFP